MWRIHGRKINIFKGKLHKAARVVLGEEIEVRGKYRKQLYIHADLEMVVSEKKNLFLRSMPTKSSESRNACNTQKRKVKVEMRKAATGKSKKSI
jgi:hypothetical protein